VWVYVSCAAFFFADLAAADSIRDSDSARDFNSVEDVPAAGASPTGDPHSFNTGSTPRQIRVGPTLRIRCRSVVIVGTVHVSVTRSPLRVARRSDGGFGNSSDGGRGGPIDAHPANQSGAPNAIDSRIGGHFMGKEIRKEKTNRTDAQQELLSFLAQPSCRRSESLP